MVGLLILYIFAASLIVLIGTAGLLRIMQRPQRRTIAWAMAHQLPQSPEDLDLESREWTARLSDESTSPGWIINGNDDDGPVVIISHGWSNSRFGSLMLAPFFVPYVSRVVVYDVRGHGDSTAKRTTLGLIEADDLASIIDQVRGEADVPNRPIVLFGSSVGAAIAIRAAAKMKQDTSRTSHAQPVGLILQGAYRDDDEPVRNRLKLVGMPPWPFMPLAVKLFRAGIPGYTPFDGPAMIRNLGPMPMLLIHGENDRVCPVEAAEIIVDAAENADLLIIPGGRHSQLAVHDPARFGDGLKRYFTQLKEGGAEDSDEQSEEVETTAM